MSLGNCIMTSGELIRTLERMGDDFITIKFENEDREYIIEKIIHVPNHSDSPCSHQCIVCRDGGAGEIRR